METIWLTRAKRIMALAQTGQAFSRDPYDVERFDELYEIAKAMLADLGNVPLAQLDGLFTPYQAAYATPSLDIRAAVVRDGRLLLVREAQDGKWSMPGGYADIGYSAAENAVKEVQEESGLTVTAERIYAVTHKVKRDYPADPRDFYKIYFMCWEASEIAPQTGLETLDVGFFAMDDLPELSPPRTSRDDVAMALEAARNPDGPIIFD